MVFFFIWFLSEFLAFNYFLTKLVFVFFFLLFIHFVSRKKKKIHAEGACLY